MFNRFLIPFYNLQTGLKTPPSDFKWGLFSSTLIILRSFNPLKWALSTNPCFFWDTLYYTDTCLLE